MASPIEVMISSTIKDLLADRDAVVKVLGSIQYVKPIGAKPIKGPSHTRNPYFVTVEMAKNCDLYILLLGRRYGDEMVDGMSPTEIEFQAAYKSDPTKHHVELKYKIFDRMYAVHFAKTQIYSDFWGSIVKLEEYFNKWKKDYYGRGH